MKIKNIQKNKGQAMLISVIFFLFISFAITVGLVGSTVREHKLVNEDLLNSKVSFFLSESGLEDAYYRVKNGMNFDSSEELELDDVSASVKIKDLGSGSVEITSVGDSENRNRKNRVILSSGLTPSFSYAAFAGARGVYLQSNSVINGDLYANYDIVGESNPLADNEVYGEVVSAGPNGYIEGVTVRGGDHAYANSSSDISVYDGANFYCGSSTTAECDGFASGDIILDSAIKPIITDVPILDADIANFELSAEQGGVMAVDCPYTITGEVTLGPVKVECNTPIDPQFEGGDTPALIIDSADVTLEGPLWVEGSIRVEGSSTFTIDSSLGNSSLPIIAHDPDRSGLIFSEISFSNESYDFSGTGQADSFIFLIGMNNDSETYAPGEDIYIDFGHDPETGEQVVLYRLKSDNSLAFMRDEAIRTSGTLSGDVFLYAPHGLVVIEHSAEVAGVYSNALVMMDNSSITYDSNLLNVIMSANVSGFNVDSWYEYAED